METIVFQWDSLWIYMFYRAPAHNKLLLTSGAKHSPPISLLGRPFGENLRFYIMCDFPVNFWDFRWSFESFRAYHSASKSFIHQTFILHSPLNVHLKSNACNQLGGAKHSPPISSRSSPTGLLEHSTKSMISMVTFEKSKNFDLISKPGTSTTFFSDISSASLVLELICNDIFRVRD